MNITLAFILAATATFADVPKGEVSKHSYTNGTDSVFPGTTRDYWLYIPAQYDPAKPACVHVNQDGIQFNAPAVFDRLIAAKEMPVTVGIFVTPGVVKSLSTNALDRFNRSYEYDSVNDNYARFLLYELLPHIVREHKLNLSTNANDRSIGGSSSGAICAFTAAWERPDAFRRVFSAIGTYVGLRGGDCYPTLIRKTEPKPLRIFLQDGSTDLNIYGGDWWMANQMMERALTFAGYEVNHAWGDGGHNHKQATEIFADAMRWLWKDWPAPVKAGQTKNAMLNDILLPGEDWQVVERHVHSSEHCTVNAKGEVFFNDFQKISKISLDGKITVFRDDIQSSAGLAFGPDGRLYVIDGLTNQVIAFSTDGKKTVIADDFMGEDIVVCHDGTTYATTLIPGQAEKKIGTVRSINPTGASWPQKRRVGGITLSPDQSLLYISDNFSPWVDSFQIHNGWLDYPQHYYYLHVLDETSTSRSGAHGMCVDRDGRLYVATLLGVQVCDQAGRVNAIIPVPATWCQCLCIAGENLDTLFVFCRNSIFKRKLKVKGALPFQPPVKPGKPRL